MSVKRPRLSLLSWLGILLLLASLNGCASYYVNAALPEVAADKMKKSNPAHPVQLLYEFQTRGTVNSTASKVTLEKVRTAVKDSGIFSDITSEPTAGGEILSITINNVPVSDDAFSKGFITGFTFGLAGSTVSDGYVCQIAYLPSAGAGKIEKSLRHMLHTNLGVAPSPDQAIKVNSIDEAITMLIRQLVSNGLFQISNDPNFK